MNYIKPNDVTSPRSRWRLHEVLYDGGSRRWSVAKGQWEEDGRWEHVLGIRWNGDGDARIGSPQSRGLPTWFIVPKELELAVYSAVEAMNASVDFKKPSPENRE